MKETELKPCQVKLCEALQDIVVYNGHKEWLSDLHKEWLSDFQNELKKLKNSGEKYINYPCPFEPSEWFTEKHTIREKQIDEMVNDLCGFYINTIAEAEQAAEHLISKGWRKQEWISVDERLPEEDEYVLIWVGKVQVARIEKGISEETRQKMKNGDLLDPVETVFSPNEGMKSIHRSALYKPADVFGNNQVPYVWKANGGPMEWFGQSVTHWMPLPEPPKMKGDIEK